MLSRRNFLKASVATAAVTALPNITKSLAATDPFMKLDATAQADLVRKGEVTAGELVEAAISRIERLNPTINALVTPSFDQARDIAKNGATKGPFQGVPYMIKDLVDQDGVRTTKGSKLFESYVAKRNSADTQAQLNLGLISLGKSNTPEFGLLATTEALALGPCRNPWNTEHSSGGSSGGAAAAVASGMIPMANASDGGGSIRIPASSCGLFGLKTSRGRTPVDPRPGSAADIGVIHVVSRSVRDSAIALHGTQLEGPGLPHIPMMTGQQGKKLKIALSTVSFNGTQPQPDVQASIEATARLCEELGHHVEEARLEIDGEEFIDAFLTVWAHGAKGITMLATKLAGGKHPKETGLLEPWTMGLADWFDARPADQVEKAVAVFERTTAQSKAFREQFDVALTPVLTSPAVKIGEQAPTVAFDTLYERTLKYVGYTPLANATGEPAMSVPLGWSKDGLPIGSQFHAGIGQEELLLDLAFQLEEAAPWANKWPTMVS